MNNTNKFELYALVLLLVMATGCQKDINVLSKSEEAPTPLPRVITKECLYAVIGEQQANPLSLEVIKEAFGRLDPKTKGDIALEDIHATHKYIAFTPSNENELYAVLDINEADMLMFAYPPDYEMTDGLVVIDDRFKVNGFSYRWAYVPVDYDLSQVACPYKYYYDICSLEEIGQTKAGKSIPSALLDAVEREAYALCGIDLTQTLQTKGSNVTPYGKVRFYDRDSSVYRGVEGLSIRTVRGLHSSYTHCNSDGTFVSSDSFKYAFRYEIHFSRTDFVIWEDESTDEIILTYSNYTGPLYIDFHDTITSFYADISRAAIVYYYGNSQGLRRPPMKNDDNTSRLAIYARHGFLAGAGGKFDPVMDVPPAKYRPTIAIYRQSNNTNLFGDTQVYAATMHELGHASHWRNNRTRYSETDTIVKESFARGVEWILTTAAYPSYSIEYLYSRRSYTGIVQDLIDGYGTKTAHMVTITIPGADPYDIVSVSSYEDLVTGFTSTQVEEAARQSKTWSQWQSYLINNNPNVANASDVSDAFDFWNS